MRFGVFPRIFTSFFNQMSEGFLPELRFCSTAETAVHRLIRRKVMRKLTPLTSGLYNVQHGVCQFALAYFRFRIPEYSSSIPFQWTSVKYVGYGLRPPFTSLMLLLYHVCFMKRSSYCAAHHSLQSEQLKIFVFKMYFSAVVNFSCGCLFCITGKEQSVETRFRPPALMCALRPCNS